MITICEHCGKEFNGRKHHGKQQRYCSHACQNAGLVIDLTGVRFGRIVITGRGNKRYSWVGVCDCGNSTEATSGSLRRNGGTRSCGCLAKQVAADTHSTHNGSKTKLYRVWINMRQRCDNPTSQAFKNYGARGIKVDQRWYDFAAFRNDMGDQPIGMSLDRIDNSGDYTADNCKWVSAKDQARNRRSNVLIEYDGQVKCVSEWAETLGVAKNAVRRTISRLK